MSFPDLRIARNLIALLVSITITRYLVAVPLLYLSCMLLVLFLISLRNQPSSVDWVFSPFALLCRIGSIFDELSL